jgi:hypothetical protein
VWLFFTHILIRIFPQLLLAQMTIQEAALVFVTINHWWIHSWLTRKLPFRRILALARPDFPTFAVAQTEGSFQRLTPNRDTPFLWKTDTGTAFWTAFCDTVVVSRNVIRHAGEAPVNIRAVIREARFAKIMRATSRRVR